MHTNADAGAQKMQGLQEVDVSHLLEMQEAVL
jgi:hypothetical protein